MDLGILDLGDAPALQADQKLAGMRLTRVITADEGVQALQFVDQALFQEEVQGAIDSGRGHPRAPSRMASMIS